MSSIDERIVQMEFDNSLFDKNVESSIKTLEKLNVALKMDGIDKNISDIASSVNKMDFSKVEDSITSLQSKFSGLTDFVTKGVTDMGSRISRAISGELDRAVQGTVRYVEKLGKQLIVDPVSDGFKEYELKMGSVQTIMNSSGASLGEVNKYLDELNTYADKTIYSFSDMTSSIGKFTNAGVELEPAVKAIQGISNVAALSGANAQQASHAMYNFAQALSSGSVKLIDWKSIENANMATKDFKNALIETAVQVGTLKKEGDQYVSTTENMQGKTSAAFDAVKGFNDSLQSQWMTTDVLTKTLAKYSNELDPLGQKAFKAATQVKTYSQLIETLKEAVGSGWAKTFELFIGDFEQARELFTSINDVVGGFIDKTSDARNNLLEQVLGGATKVSEDAAEGMEKAGEAADTAAKSFEEYQKIAEEVRQGKWDDGAARVKKLTEAGYDYDAVMSIVNHDILGWELNMELINKALEKTTETTKEAADATEDLAEANEKSGRELLIEAFARVANSAITTFRTLGEAWRQVFPPVTAEALKNGIKTFNNFTKELVLNSTTVYKLRNVFKGLLAPLSILFDAVAGLARAVFTPLFNIVTTLGNWLLRILSPIGKFVAGIAKAVHESDIFYKVINGIVQFISPLFESIGKIGDSITKTLAVGLYKAGDAIMSVGSKIKEFWGALKETRGFQRFNKVIGSIGEAFGKVKNKAIDRVTKFFDDLGKVKIDIPGLDVTNIADAAGQALDFLAGKIVIARQRIASFFTDIKINENNPLHGIYTYFSNLSAQGLIDSVSSKLKSAGSSVKKFFKETGIAAKAQQTFNTVISNIKETAPQMFQGLLDIFGKVGTSILEAKDKVVEFWGSFKQTQGFQTLKSGVVNVFNSILNAIGKASTGIANFFKSIFGSFKDFKMPEINMENISSGVSSIVEWIKEKFESIKTTVSSIFSGAGSTGSDALDSITGFFTNLDLSNGISGITDGLTKAKEAILEFFKTIGELFSGKDAGASELDKTAESAKTLGERVEEGASGFQSLLDILGQIRDKVTEVWNKVKPFIEDIARIKLLFGAGSAFSEIGKFFKKFGKFFEGLNVEFSLTAAKIREGIGRVSKAASHEFNSRAVRNVAIALGILAASFWALAQIKPDQFDVAVKGLIAISVALIVLMGAFRLFFGGAGGITLNPLQEFQKIMAEFGTKMSKALSKFGIAAIILSMAVAIKMLTGVIKELGEMDTGVLIKGGIAVAAIATALTFMVKALTVGEGRNGFGQSVGVALSLLALAAAINLLIGPIQKLGKMKLGELIKGVGAIAAIMIALGVAIALTDKVNPAPLIAVIAIIAEVILGMLALSILPSEKLDGVAKALTKAFLSVAAIIAALGFAESSAKNISGLKLGGLLIGIGAIIAEVMYGLSTMTELSDDQVAKLDPISTALSRVYWSVAGIIAALALFNSFKGSDAATVESVKSAGKDAGTLKTIGIIAVITGITGIIGGLNNVIDEKTGTDILETVAEAFEAWDPIIDRIGTAIGTLLGSLAKGIIKGFTGKDPEAIVNEFTKEIQSFPETMQKWVEGIGKFVDDTKSASEDGRLDADAIGDLKGIIDDMGSMAETITQIVSDFYNQKHSFNTIIQDNGDVSIDSTSMTEWFTGWAEAFSSFSNTITTTVIDPDTVSEQLTGVNTMLTDFTDVISAASGLGDIELATSKIELLPNIAGALFKYSWTMPFLNAGAVESTKTAVDIINAAASDAIVNGQKSAEGFTAIVGAGSALAQYSEDLPGFGTALKTFCEEVDGMEAYDDIMPSVKTTGEIINNLAASGVKVGKENIVTSEGFSGFVSALNSVSTDLPGFATGLKGFAENIDGLQDHSTAVAASETAVNIINALAAQGVAVGQDNIISTLGSDGNVITALKNYSDDLSGFATALVSYAAIIDLMNVGAVMKTWAASAMIVALTNAIPDTDSGLMGLLFGSGDQSISNFNTQLPEIATAFVKFSDIAEGFDETNAQKVLDAFETIVTTADLLANYAERTGGNMADIESNAAIEMVSSAIEALSFEDLEDNAELEDLVNIGEELGKSIKKSISDGIVNGLEASEDGTDAKSAGESALSKLVKSLFGDSSSVTAEIETMSIGTDIANAVHNAVQNGVNEPSETTFDMTTFLGYMSEGIKAGEGIMMDSGSNLATAVASGLRSNRWAASSAGSSLGSAAVSGARSHYSNMYSAGEYVGAGFAAGIKSEVSAAITATTQMANSAVQNTKAKLKQNSPSRVFMDIGSGVVEGFVKGINDNRSFVANATTGMALLSVGTATDSLDSGIEEMAKSASKSIAAAYTYINNVASQSLNSSPVITPVLDMSMLQNGMNYANGLWGLNGYNPFGYANSMFPSSAYQYTNGMMANDAYVTQTELRGIRTDLKNLGEAITHMNMVLDSGTLVGQLTPGIDSQLGAISGLKERWA